MPTLPTITLDSTVTDLYRQSSSEHAAGRIGHIFCGVSSTLDLTADFPRNLKYIYQDGSFQSALKSDEEYRRSLAIKFLSIVPQRDAILTGQAPVLLFHTGSKDAQRIHDAKEVATTLDVLDPSQRSKVIFSRGPRSLHDIVQSHKIERLCQKIILDSVVDLTDDPQGAVEALIDCDVIWYLNSKKALAQSGLPTPKTTVVEIDEYEDQAKWCTPGYDTPKNHKAFDPDYTSDWTQWLDEQARKITTAIKQHPIPFVVKGNQAFGGSGTYTVESEDDRDELLSDFTKGGHIKKLLSYITLENEHLNIGTFLLSDLIRDPLSNFGLTFFVTTTGTPIFLGASEQMIDRESSNWIGSTINFSRQEELRRKLEPIMKKTVIFLHKHEYFGPVGIDVLETQGYELLIVDMNVRTSGSMCLPLMKTHFTSRGLDAASSFSITVDESREGFIRRFEPEFEGGKMVIAAWYEDQELGKSYGDVVVGAEDEEALGRMIERVRDVSGTVTF